MRWYYSYIYMYTVHVAPPLSTRIPGPSISRRGGMDRNRLCRPFIILLHPYSFAFSARSETLFGCQIWLSDMPKTDSRPMSLGASRQYR